MEMSRHGRRDRLRALDELIDSLALDEFAAAHGSPELPEVAVVVAAYHERDNIGAVVTSVPALICGLPAACVVVVDGDEDGTAAIVREAGHFAVVAPLNRGQGAALRLGYRVARTFGARYLVTADGDGQADPSDLATVLGPVVDGDADFVNGSRRLGRTEHADPVRNLGVVVYGAIISALLGTRVTDTANPIRAMRADLPAHLSLEEPQYQASELLMAAVASGARFTERPVTMRKRATGRSQKGGNLAYGLRYGRVVARVAWRERRRRPGS